MFISVILYKPTAMMIVPTMVRTEAGLYLERGRVEVAPIVNTAACLASLESIRQAGIQIVRHPEVFTPAAKTPSVIAARAKSWTDFVRNAHLWHITVKADGSLQIEGWTSPPGKNHFEPEPGTQTTFAPETPVAAVFQAIIQILQSELEKPA